MFKLLLEYNSNLCSLIKDQNILELILHKTRNEIDNYLTRNSYQDMNNI